MNKNMKELYQQERDKRSQELFNKNESELNLEEILKLDKYIHDISNPIWRSLIIHEDGTFIFINNLGEIKRCDKKDITVYKNSSNYSTVWIPLSNTKTDKKVPKLIHRLVAEAFIPNPENKPQVNHINGKRDFNWVGNLEWVTAKENISHTIKSGNQIIGENHKHSKFSNEQIREVCKLLESDYINIKDIMEKTKVSRKTINNIRFSNGWSHISKDYNINKNVLKSGPRFSEITLRLIEIAKTESDDEKVLKQIRIENLVNNLSDKQIKDRLYHIRKNII